MNFSIIVRHWAFGAKRRPGKHPFGVLPDRFIYAPLLYLKIKAASRRHKRPHLSGGHRHVLRVNRVAVQGALALERGIQNQIRVGACQSLREDTNVEKPGNFPLKALQSFLDSLLDSYFLFC